MEKLYGSNMCLELLLLVQNTARSDSLNSVLNATYYCINTNHRITYAWLGTYVSDTR